MCRQHQEEAPMYDQQILERPVEPEREPEPADDGCDGGVWFLS